MITRPRALERIHRIFQVHPVTAILGPRQCGKTTLSRMFAAPAASFDLENPTDLQKLSAPMHALERLSGLVIIDEIQRKPALFEVLRVLVDRPDNPARFLVLGSASPSLVSSASESLSGRVGFLDLSGFDLIEVGPTNLLQLWVRGGFPRSYLAPDDDASQLWRSEFVRTFLERDVPQLGLKIPAETLRRFWTMISHYHGQIWNVSEFARALGASEPTARRYLDILVGAFMVRILPPWFENLGKRQVKAPKVYVRDAGLLHSLLQVPTLSDLRGHPKIGASWEGFAIENILGILQTRDAYFWATHAGAELDLMVIVKGRRFGFEFKFADAPSTSRSMHVALGDLGLDHLWVVYPGRDVYELTDRITVLPLEAIESVLTKIMKGGFPSRSPHTPIG